MEIPVLDSFLGKALRHLASAGAGALAITGISQSSAEEVIFGLLTYVVNVFISKKLG